jgi:hypothetical protein
LRNQNHLEIDLDLVVAGRDVRQQFHPDNVSNSCSTGKGASEGQLAGAQSIATAEIGMDLLDQIVADLMSHRS